MCDLMLNVASALSVTQKICSAALFSLLVLVGSVPAGITINVSIHHSLS